MAYATDEQVALGEALGYAHDKCAERGSSFTNGVRNVWATREGWQTADLIDGYYRNHKKFAGIGDALKRELT